MSLIPQLGLPAVDQKQRRSYHRRYRLRHYIGEPGLRRLADSKIESILRMCHGQQGKHASQIFFLMDTTPIYMFGYINCPILQSSASMSKLAKSVYA